ncbi:MAG: methyltransferase domain-containing protein [Planctomycetota bacterium]
MRDPQHDTPFNEANAGGGIATPALGESGVFDPSATMLAPIGVDSWDAWLERIERVYQESEGEADRIPWSSRRPNPSLLAWLNVEAPRLVRPGARVAVVGCGLGFDAASLVDRGYDVEAFDACASAIDWARRLHPQCASAFHKADIRDMPARTMHRFDLVVEVHTIQALPPRYRPEIAKGVCDLVGKCGVLIAIARGRDASVPLADVTGPPFELTAPELHELIEAQGLEALRPIDDFEDDNAPPVRRLRGVFQRTR